MNGTEFKTLRERLGLSDQDVAVVLAGVNARTIRHWESGRSKPKDDVVLALKKLNATIENNIIETLDLVAQNTEKYGKPKAIDLVRYASAEKAEERGQPMLGIPKQLSFKIRNALLRRTADALEMAGYNVEIKLI